jgi:hypothetical protein
VVDIHLCRNENSIICFTSSTATSSNPARHVSVSSAPPLRYWFQESSLRVTLQIVLVAHVMSYFHRHRGRSIFIKGWSRPPYRIGYCLTAASNQILRCRSVPHQLLRKSNVLREVSNLQALAQEVHLVSSGTAIVISTSKYIPVDRAFAHKGTRLHQLHVI